MIKSHVDLLQFPDSITLYRELKKGTVFYPDNFTFTSLAKACGLSLLTFEGQQIHNHVGKTGFCSDLFVSTALVDMYVKFGKLVFAKKMFDEMNHRSQVSFTALIVGFARCGDICSAWNLFNQMPERDAVAFNAMMDASVKVGDMNSARVLFNQMQDKNVVSYSTMICGCCNIGDVTSARELFDCMPERNLFSWNSMISGYCRNKKPCEALKLFREMQSNTLFEPDEVTIVSILPAIADFGDLELGNWIHRIVKKKRLEKSTKVGTSLVDMYAKCGDTMNATRVFEEMEDKETASWNALINGFAVNGSSKEALKLFMEMQNRGFKPNEITMLGVLSACNHGGLVEEGKRWFKRMDEYDLVPQIEHYGCMVDLLGRAGLLDEAEKLIESMPYEANGIILSSFLFACGYRKDIKRAENVMKKVIKLEPFNDGNYVMMRNLYAEHRRWGDADEMKKLMRTSGAKKETGSSVIEIESRTLEFVAGDKLHPNWEMIDRVLAQLWLHMKAQGTNFGYSSQQYRNSRYFQ